MPCLVLGTITAVNWIDVGMQFLAICTAAWVSMLGWSRTAAHAKKVSDDADCQLIHQVLRHTLPAVATDANQIAKHLASGQPIAKLNLQAFDSMLRAYKDHWPKVLAIQDPKLRERVLDLFVYVDIARPALELYTRENPEALPAGEAHPETLKAANLWRDIAATSQELFTSFGFTEPAIPQAGPKKSEPDPRGRC